MRAVSEKSFLSRSSAVPYNSSVLEQRTSRTGSGASSLPDMHDNQPAAARPSRSNSAGSSSSKSRVFGLALVVAAVLAGCAPDTDPATVLPRAQEALQSQETRRAVILLRNLLEKHPEHAEARALLGAAWLAEGDLLAAEVELERSLRIDDGSADAALTLAEVRLALGKPDDALGLLAGLADRALSGEQQYRRELGSARAHLARADLDAATLHFERARSLDGGRAAPLLGLARAAALAGDEPGARARVEEALAVDPASSESWLLSGLIEIASGDYPAACARFRRADELDAERGGATYSVLVALGECQLIIADREGAEATVARLAEHFPSQPVTGYLDARLAVMRGDFPAALQRLRAVAASHPNFVAAEGLLGAVHLELGNLEQARQHARAAIAAEPQSRQLRLLLAEIERRRGDPGGAAGALVSGLTASASNVDLFLLAARTELAAGDADVGLALLRNAVDVDPKGWSLALETAAGLIARGDMERARGVLEAMPSDADSGFARQVLLVASYVADGEHAAAAREVDALLESDPDNRSVLTLAGAVREIAGELDDAGTFYARAAQLPGDSIGPHLGLARIGWMRGDISGAHDVLAAAVDEFPNRIELRLALADVLARRGDRASARAVLDGRSDDLDPAALAPLASAYVRLGAVDAAEALARRAVETRGGSPEAWLLLAAVQGAAGNHDAQIETFDRALSAHPSHRGLADGKLAALTRAGRFDEADAWLGEAGAFDADETALRRAALRTAEGRFADAERLLDSLWNERPRRDVALERFRARIASGAASPEQPLLDWLEAEPNDVEARLALAAFQLGTGEWAAAGDNYRRILEQSADSVVALNNLAWLYGQSNDERALEVASRAYRLAPARPEIIDTYGWLLLGSGRDVRLAARLLAQAAWLAPGNADIQFHFAAALAATERPGEARSLLEDLLRSRTSFDSRSDAEALLAKLSEG